MLGFYPLAGASIGGSAVVREVILADVTGVQASVTLGVISLSTDATISDQAVRKPETVFFDDPNNDGVGVVRRNERNFYTWTNAFILGMRPQIFETGPDKDNTTSGPIWDESVAGDKALSVQTKITSELTSDPIVSQSSWVPLVNGDYTYPATYEAALGYDASNSYPVTVNLNHLPSESIVNNAATISTLGDPLLTTLVFPANDPTLFNAIVGQVRTINTFDTTDTVTYFYSLINGQVGEVQWPNESKHYLLQKYDTDKGFDLGTLSTNTFVRTKDHPFQGSAYTAYGFRLQPQVTTANFPDGTPVSQEHTLLVTSSLGVIKVNISKELPALPVTVGTNLGIKANVTASVYKEIITPPTDPDIPVEEQDLTPFKVGFDLTAGLPDPQWYLSTSRVEIIAEPNQPANDVIYPYASRSPTAGPTQTDFDFAISLGVLDGPIGVDQPVDGFDTTLTLGTPTLKSLNTLAVDSQVVTLGLNLSGIEAQPTEIIYPSDSILLTPSLGSIETLATSNAVCTSRLTTLGLGNITFAANANTAPSSGVEFTGAAGEITFTVDANLFPDGLEFVASVGIAGVPALARITTAGFATVTIGAVGVGAVKLVSGFGIDVQFGPDLTVTGFKFDFEAIKHLYNVLRQVHGGFPANRTARPTFSSPRNIRPPKPSKNLAA